MTEPHEPNARNRISEPPPGVPRWVKVVLIAIAILVVVMLVVGGEHGPGLHTGASTVTLTSSGPGDAGQA